MEEGRNRRQVTGKALESLQRGPWLCPLKALFVFFVFSDPNIQVRAMRRSTLKMPM